jgi:N-formylglutamate amidohydrolase
LQARTRDSSARTADPADQPWSIEVGDGPVVAAAIHAGHEVRPDVAEWLVAEDADRLREEDPLTGLWTTVGDSAIRVFRSRFEVDLNRPRHLAIALDPKASWGLPVWREQPPERVLDRSLGEYDAFYEDLRDLFDRLTTEWNSILVLDLHSYNHRRDGPDRPAQSLVAMPEINVGTGSLERSRWASLVDRFIEALRLQKYRGRVLDVRENVKFRGGHFSSWLHETYPNRVCVLALEFKKIFMDEWIGTANIMALEDIRVALRNAVNTVRQELTRVR